MVNQTSALSPPGRIQVVQIKALDPFSPLFDQSTYSGRLKNCFRITNPRLLFAPESELFRARCIVAKFRKSIPLPPCLTKKELVDARILYESSFHPITGEKLFALSRLCAQIPMKALLLGSVLTYYDYCMCANWIPWIGTHALYQSYLALLNYSNRSYSKYNTFNMVSSFLVGSGTAIGTHFLLCKMLEDCKHYFLRRYIPLVAVSAATAVSIPVMRAKEMNDGIPVYYRNENFLGFSKRAGSQAIYDTTCCRLMSIVPGMFLAPFIMNKLYCRGLFCRHPWLQLPINIAIMGGSLLLSVPLACALYPQRYELPIKWFEENIKKAACREPVPPKHAYFIKGN
ncbi:sideroflexin-1-like [Chrysoperla carnea]|uniref:sideroflexin-1-like n=1 Tax=Chrysoperla carnea TaxID=189513 RepID=UPI001D083336|nr:sideroflexin-1-like [Chrysoperla carnea]